MPRGGTRLGAGRKPSENGARVKVSLALEPDIVAYLDSLSGDTSDLKVRNDPTRRSRNDVVNDLIRRTKAFKEWSQENNSEK